jgi:hypothetical protein
VYLASQFDQSTCTYPVHQIFYVYLASRPGGKFLLDLSRCNQPARWEIFIGSFYVYLARHVTIFIESFYVYTVICRIAKFYWIFLHVPSMFVRSFFYWIFLRVLSPLGGKFLLDLSTYLARPFNLSTCTYPVRPIFLRVPSQPARWQIFIGSFYVYLTLHVIIFY